MAFVLSTPTDPGTGAPPGNTAAWTDLATLTQTIQLVYSEDISPAPGISSLLLLLPVGVITGGEILSVVLVTQDSGEAFSQTIPFVTGITMDATDHFVSITFASGGLARAGDSLITVRIYGVS